MKNNWRTEYYRPIDFRAERELRGISIEAFARTTKYSKRQLERFENGRFDELPNQIFLRGMIKVYIQRLGLDPDMVQLEYLHQTESQNVTDGDTSSSSENGTRNPRLWTANLGPIAGFFLCTGLAMVLLWPAKDLTTLTYAYPSSASESSSRIEWREARKSLEHWSEGRVMLMDQPVELGEMTTVKSGRKGVRIESETPGWVRVQDMVTGAERLISVFPGESIFCTVEDETVMWFENPGGVVLIDNASHKVIKKSPPEVIRFIPETNHFIIEERDAG